MKYVPKRQAQKIANNDACIVYEYPMGDHDIDGAIAEIAGRYPEAGFAANRRSKELVHVLSGRGKLVTQHKAIDLGEGDSVLILPDEAYYFVGENLRIYMACNPAWSSDQHEIIEG